ncbi:MAG: FliA/WhiG family RNA polymerase sigma factor [Firmicutes bacterium]|jgi:RNA polymerase sigma factor for flagellar operon FliA|nr:FliA/WhiG family RNA polymerase sigma factor [Bacillota bacterium]
MSLNEVWKRFKEKNDKQAKEELIIKYVELVKVICGRLYPNYSKYLEFDELVSYGIIGLIDAIDKFDYKKEVKFETYGNIRIRGAIIDQLRSMDWVPRSTRQKFKQIEKAIDILVEEKGNDFSDKDIAIKVEMSVEDVNELLAEMSTFSILSLEEKIEDSNSNFELKSNNKDFSPEDNLLNDEFKNTLVGVIESLPNKEQMVIKLYYYSELTYKEIASIMGISESRISQIHSKAISKIKNSIEV